MSGSFLCNFEIRILNYNDATLIFSSIKEILEESFNAIGELSSVEESCGLFDKKDVVWVTAHNSTEENKAIVGMCQIVKISPKSALVFNLCVKPSLRSQVFFFSRK